MGETAPRGRNQKLPLVGARRPRGTSRRGSSSPQDGGERTGNSNNVCASIGIGCFPSSTHDEDAASWPSTCNSDRKRQNSFTLAVG